MTAYSARTATIRSLATAGDDDIWGGDGADTIFGDAGNDRIWGDEGADIIEGGAGSDVVNAGANDDVVLATMNDGDDVYMGGDGVDTYNLSAITADTSVNLLNGSSSGAQVGNDALSGFENVVGGFGNDEITANASTNVLTGGHGDDTFVFTSASAADGDTITDFQPGDRIDVSMIDANALAGGNQDFQLIMDPVFTDAGQVMFSYASNNGTDLTIVSGQYHRWIGFRLLP